MDLVSIALRLTEADRKVLRRIALLSRESLAFWETNEDTAAHTDLSAKTVQRSKEKFCEWGLLQSRNQDGSKPGRARGVTYEVASDLFILADPEIGTKVGHESRTEVGQDIKRFSPLLSPSPKREGEEKIGQVGQTGAEERAPEGTEEKTPEAPAPALEPTPTPEDRRGYRELSAVWIQSADEWPSFCVVCGKSTGYLRSIRPLEVKGADGKLGIHTTEKQQAICASVWTKASAEIREQFIRRAISAPRYPAQDFALIEFLRDHPRLDTPDWERVEVDAKIERENYERRHFGRTLSEAEQDDLIFEGVLRDSIMRVDPAKVSEPVAATL